MTDRWGRDRKLGPLSEVLGRVASEAGLRLPPGLVTVWPEVVGELVAEHVWPAALREGVLEVVADNQHWLRTVAELGPTLPPRLSARGFAVEEIVCRSARPGEDARLPGRNAWLRRTRPPS